MTDGSRPAPLRISKIIAVTVDLPLVPRHRDRAMGGDEMREQLRAVDDRNAERARRGDVGHLLLDRGRDDERGAVGAEPAAVLR